MEQELPLLHAERVLDAKEPSTITRSVGRVFAMTDRARGVVDQALKRAFPEYHTAKLSLVDMLLQLSCWFHVARGGNRRYIDFLEYYAGEAEITRGMLGHGIQSKAMDIVYGAGCNGDSVYQDGLTAKGFRHWVLSLLFVSAGGDQWHAVVCSSWVWMSRCT